MKRGLFFFWDSLGLPIDIAIARLRQTGISTADEFMLICEFVADARRAGWSREKVKGDLREANQCGDLRLPTWMVTP